MTETEGVVRSLCRRFILFVRWFEGTSDPAMRGKEKQVCRVRGVWCTRWTLRSGALVITSQRLVFLPSRVDPVDRLFLKPLELRLSEIDDVREKSAIPRLWARMMRMQPWEIETVDGMAYQFTTGSPDTVVRELRELGAK